MRSIRICVLWVALTVMLPWCQALYPEPGNIYYGVVRASDGRRMGTADGVRLVMLTSRTNTVAGLVKVDTLSVAESAVIDASEENPNFILKTSLDGGGGERYSPIALRTGEQVRLVLVSGGRTNELLGAVPPVGGRGAIVQSSLRVPCVDVDQDGLCDEWEILHFGSIQVTNGTTDFDKDGLSDFEEFMAGTNPKDPNDPIRTPLVVSLILVTEDGVTVEWNRVVGRRYRVEMSSDPTRSFVPVPPGRLVGNPDASGAVQIKSDGEPYLFLRVLQE